MKIINLHGFGSAGDSPKSRALKDVFGENAVISPDLPIDPDDVIAMVGNFVHESKRYPIVFVGTSLGGFYANYFAQRYDAPCVLINPCTQPSKTLVARLGKNKNYLTGQEFEITERHLTTFAAMEHAIEDKNGALISLFLSEDDAVLDPAIALQYFPFTKTKVVTKDGGHRFEKYWDTVIDHIKTIY
jgi:predicted esterase YcpF (UPF0227 family)